MKAYRKWNSISCGKWNSISCVLSKFIFKLTIPTLTILKLTAKQAIVNRQANLDLYSVCMSTVVLESERSRLDAFLIFALSSLSVHASAKVAEMLKQL